MPFGLSVHWKNGHLTVHVHQIGPLQYLPMMLGHFEKLCWLAFPISEDYTILDHGLRTLHKCKVIFRNSHKPTSIVRHKSHLNTTNQGCWLVTVWVKNHMVCMCPCKKKERIHINLHLIASYEEEKKHHLPCFEMEVPPIPPAMYSLHFSFLLIHHPFLNAYGTNWCTADKISLPQPHAAEQGVLLERQHCPWPECKQCLILQHPPRGLCASIETMSFSQFFLRGAEREWKTCDTSFWSWK